MRTVKVGIIGCGNISAAYLRTIAAFPTLECVACADMFVDRAEARAKEFGVARAGTVEELLADPEVEIVINLTIPQAHKSVSLAALEAGKHVYTEKPLSVTVADGEEVLAKAESLGLRVGCAPGTFLGAGLQTCRELIDQGAIGQPVACTGFMMGHGPEGWHPDPFFFYKEGAGPMFDMGPYYLTTFTTLLGPVQSISATAGIQIAEREIGSEPHRGEVIQVETPDHVTGTLRFENGAIGTLLTTFAVWKADLPFIEIYGTEGTLSVPNPNSLGGPVKIAHAGDKEWTEVPVTRPYSVGSTYWGIGVADMAYAIVSGRAHRASGKQGCHVLECMSAFLRSSETGKRQDLVNKMERPAPLPAGLEEGTLDL